MLVVSTDPAHSLGDCLGRRLSSRPTRVPARRGRLEAVELDADRALERWLSARRGQFRLILDRGTYLDAAEIDRFLDLSLPGVDELIGLVELQRLAGGAPYDRVVVDMAPTGHALRLLGMPATLRRIAAVLDEMQAKHRLIAARLGQAPRADAADALIEEIATTAGQLERALRQHARFTWVLVPEALALEEAKDAVAALEAAGLRVDEIVVNRLTAPPRGCAACTARRCAEQAVLDAAVAWAGDRVVRVIPELPREPRGARPLRAVAARLSRPAPGRRARRPGAAQPLVSLVPGPRRPARPGPADEGWLDRLLPDGLRLLVVAGKGGAGKTSCAAAIALGLARRPGREILLLSTDPAHSLGDVLLAPVGDEERPVPGAPPGLRARELDAERTLALRRDRYRKAVEAFFDALRGGSRFDPAFDRAIVQGLMDLAPSGLDEIFGTLAVVEALFPSEAGRRPYDTVVLDTAPTGHALRLLALPEAALEWVHALMEILLEYRALAGLGELGADLVQAARDLKRLSALLRDPARSRVLAVTRAATVPALETRRLLAALERLQLPLGALVVNALTAGCRHGLRAREEARVVAAYRRAAAADRPDRRSSGRRRCAMILSPSVVPPPRGPAALERWRRAWEVEVQGREP